MYAWCAYDAVYAPGVIGANAIIESVDPLSKKSIRIEMSPEGVSTSVPEGIYVTVVGLEADSKGGDQSPRCSQMNFFVSEENADKWATGRPGVVVMTIDQLYELAQEFQIEPARQMGLLS